MIGGEDNRAGGRNAVSTRYFNGRIISPHNEPGEKPKNVSDRDEQVHANDGRD